MNTSTSMTSSIPGTAWAGSEKGLADTDRCHYYKIAENLYFSCLEREDRSRPWGRDRGFRDYEDRGQDFGYQGTDFGAVVNFPVGARARILGMSPTTPETRQMLQLS